MKIEKLTENKIRIILDSTELPDFKNIDKLINSDINTNKFFLDILNKAEKDYGFKTDNCKLLIEAFSSVDNMYILTITKYSVKKKNSNKKTHYYLQHCLTYKFNSFEEFCLLCEQLNLQRIPVENIANKVSLYYYNNTYYLVFLKLNFSYKHFKKLLFLVSEFASIKKYNYGYSAKILEHGKPILIKNAFKIGIKYFAKEKT